MWCHDLVFKGNFDRKYDNTLNIVWQRGIRELDFQQYQSGIWSSPVLRYWYQNICCLGALLVYLLFDFQPARPCVCWIIKLLLFFCLVNVPNCFRETKDRLSWDSSERYPAFVSGANQVVPVVGGMDTKIFTMFFSLGNWIENYTRE